MVLENTGVLGSLHLFIGLLKKYKILGSFRKYTGKIKKRGCVKMYTSSFLCTKPRLSQARALLFPKVFVPLGIKKISL